MGRHQAWLIMIHHKIRFDYRTVYGRAHRQGVPSPSQKSHKGVIDGCGDGAADQRGSFTERFVWYSLFGMTCLRARMVLRLRVRESLSLFGMQVTMMHGKTSSEHVCTLGCTHKSHCSYRTSSNGNNSNGLARCRETLCRRARQAIASIVDGRVLFARVMPYARSLPIILPTQGVAARQPIHPKDPQVSRWQD